MIALCIPCFLFISQYLILGPNNAALHSKRISSTRITIRHVGMPHLTWTIVHGATVSMARVRQSSLHHDEAKAIQFVMMLDVVGLCMSLASHQDVAREAIIQYATLNQACKKQLWLRSLPSHMSYLHKLVQCFVCSPRRFAMFDYDDAPPVDG